jgi:hypothetical protein
MRRLLPVFFLAMTLSVQAQPPIPWWENPIGNGLNLSDAQLVRINTILGEYRERLTVERQEAERAEHDFENSWLRLVACSQRTFPR